LRRILVDNTAARTEHDIPDFARSHDELVIAQWISTIDKIARKPSGHKKPSPEQREFRHKLGKVCWLRLTEGGYLPGATGANRGFLNDLWWFKIHPYGSGTAKPPSDPDKAPKLKGRWYEVFAGDCAPDKVDADKIAEIAAAIEKHLYSSESRLGQDVPPRRQGKIEERANSISTNVLRIQNAPGATNEQAEWSNSDIEAYKHPGDPVSAIYEEALALEREHQRVTLPIAAKKLFKHWADVFRAPESDAVMKVEEARQKCPGMCALHMQLKRCYSRLLKRTRKDTREHRKHDREERRLSTLLPRNLDQALNLSRKQDANADLGHLVRLGKVIHYAASDGTADHPKAIKDNWPENIDASRFWSSEGQAEIKRAEAFVRIWRQALVLAGLTLKDWVSKAPYEGDILGGEDALNKAVDPGRFDRAHFDRKLLLLFGNRTDALAPQTDADCLILLRGLIEAAAKLRHAVFHFKGRAQLLNELAELPKRFSGPLIDATRRLWQADATDRSARLRAALGAAHLQRFLTPDQVAQVFGLLTKNALAELPLPRFSRVLSRAENAWGRDNTVKLPEPANQRALEAPARLCQYTILKLVYERPFRSWLKNQGAEVISAWIDRAVARATEAAKAMNAKGDEVARKVIAARAADLPKPRAGSDIVAFFFDLSSATASETRVQRGYESDPERAREQAGYIDDLLCDVIVLSLVQYLVTEKLNWVLELKAEQTPSEQPTCSLNELQTPEPVVDAEDWQAALYLALHLVPVESVGRLLHQLFKWNIAAGRDNRLTTDDEARLGKLFATMTLYLDMHDAKFEGGNLLVGCKEFGVLFESEKGFNRVFSQALNQETDHRIPRRGLREIMRFGHLPLLQAISVGASISDATIDRVLALEAPQNGGPSRIASLQQSRENLHDKWVKGKRNLGVADLEVYCKTLAEISEHRQDSALVNLLDHVRVHRLIMAVLGRLVDYVGLFERDLYFAVLALLYRHDALPEQMFNEKGLTFLLNGQIIFALRNHRKESQLAVEVLKELTRHFTKVWDHGNPVTSTRNNLAHLNMLQGATPTPRLTHWVNQTRRLMTYDRKLKNAVSKSVIELMAREGIELYWEMKIEGSAHDLANAKLSSRCVKHLGGKRLRLRDSGSGGTTVLLEERLHSDGFVDMMADAFGGKARRKTSIVEYVSKVDWEASTERRK
jgi:hypothetical protein